MKAFLAFESSIAVNHGFESQAWKYFALYSIVFSLQDLGQKITTKTPPSTAYNPPPPHELEVMVIIFVVSDS